jgi:prepilin-type N-terminal cleavage/methylation domain-containing protein
MISLKRKQSGFTIVELLIVIVVIGILVALVVTTFSGIQRKARNTERESDVKAIHSQLEAYFNEQGAYPELGSATDDGINNSGWRSTSMKSLDPEALKDPKGTDQLLCGAVTDTCYGYVTDGATYTLTANLEGGGTYEKKNLN